MRSLAVAGLCLIAATVVCVVGSLIDAPRVTSATSAVGACTAFAGAAAAYGATVGTPRRALPSIGLALLGIAASVWMVEATLRIAGAAAPVGQVLPVLAVVAGGVGLALLAGAVWRAGLVPRPAGLVLAASATLGALFGDPVLLYLLGAVPLGIALLWTAQGAQRTARRELTQ